MTSAVDSYEPMPAGIGVTSSDPLTVTIVADPSIGVGPLQPVWLIVSDAYGGSIEITVTIEIVLPPNALPVATSPYTLLISVGETRVLPLDQSHLVSDPNGDDMTLEVVSWPAPLANKPEVGAPLGALQMSVTMKPVVDPGPVLDPIVTRVTDSRGGSILVETYLEVVRPSHQQPADRHPVRQPGCDHGARRHAARSRSARPIPRATSSGPSLMARCPQV